MKLIVYGINIIRIKYQQNGFYIIMKLLNIHHNILIFLQKFIQLIQKLIKSLFLLLILKILMGLNSILFYAFFFEGYFKQI